MKLQFNWNSDHYPGAALIEFSGRLTRKDFVRLISAVEQMSDILGTLNGEFDEVDYESLTPDDEAVLDFIANPPADQDSETE